MTLESINDHDGESRLTPAALEALGELTTAYRARLVEQAMLDHTEGAISGVDFMRSAYSEQDPDDVKLRRNRVADIARVQEIQIRSHRTLLVFVLGTGILGVVALVIFVGLGRIDVLSESLSLIAPIATILAVMLGYLLGRRESRLFDDLMRLEVRRHGWTEFVITGNYDALVEESMLDAASEDVNWRFIHRWQELENHLDDLTHRVLEVPADGRLSIGTALKQLTYQGTLSDAQSNLIKRLLSVRNDLVHGGLPNNYVVTDDLEELIRVNKVVEGLLQVAPAPTSMSKREK